MTKDLEIISDKKDISHDKLQTTKVFGLLAKAINDGYSTISLQGSSRSSKTYNILIFLVIYCQLRPKTSVSIVRGSLPVLRRSAMRDFFEILGKLNIYSESRHNKTNLIYTFSNGSFVEFFSAESEEKLRGSERDILYVNEANELKYIEWQQLKLRTKVLAIIDYNPSFSDDHWICDVNKDKYTYHFITTYKDNPFLPQTIINEIERLQRKNKSLWEVYGLGRQSIIEGLIFPDIRIIEEFPEHAKRQAIGIDYGFTNDPTAIIRCGIIDDNLYLDELCYETDMLSKDIINILKPLKMKVLSESADPRLIKEISNAGVLIYPVKKGQGSVNAGIMKMKEYNIHITKNSFNFIKEKNNYTYIQNKDGKFINEPIDAYNHCFDATRYYVMGEMLGRITITKQVTKEDFGIF